MTITVLAQSMSFKAVSDFLDLGPIGLHTHDNNKCLLIQTMLVDPSVGQRSFWMVWIQQGQSGSSWIHKGRRNCKGELRRQDRGASRLYRSLFKERGEGRKQMQMISQLPLLWFEGSFGARDPSVCLLLLFFRSIRVKNNA